MFKYMVVVFGDGSTWAKFFDDLVKAERYREDAECGMGYYAEVYERVVNEHGREYKQIYC